MNLNRRPRPALSPIVKGRSSSSIHDANILTKLDCVRSRYGFNLPSAMNSSISFILADVYPRSLGSDTDCWLSVFSHAEGCFRVICVVRFPISGRGFSSSKVAQSSLLGRLLRLHSIHSAQYIHKRLEISLRIAVFTLKLPSYSTRFSSCNWCLPMCKCVTFWSSS